MQKTAHYRFKLQMNIQRVSELFKFLSLVFLLHKQLSEVVKSGIVF